MAIQPTGETDGSRVSWESYAAGQQRLHDEQIALRSELAARDKHFMDRLLEIREDMTARDREHADILAEVRDSLGDMHRALLGLPCDEHKIALAHLGTDMGVLRARTPDWQALRRILPVFRPKVVLGLFGVLAGLLGWDWWGRFSATVERWIR